MKKILLCTLFTATLIGLVGCSGDNLASIDNTSPTSNNENVPINFGTYLGNAQNTRAYEGGSINTTEQLANADGFGIFAMNTETKTYVPDNGDDHTLFSDFNYMFDQQVAGKTSGGTTTWETSPVKYWPNKTWTYTTTGEGKDQKTTTDFKPQHVTFFAYAPYVNINNGGLPPAVAAKGTAYYEGSGILAISNPEEFNSYMADADQNNWFSKADPVIALDVTDASNQTDLLWGTAGDNGATEDGDAQSGKNLKNDQGGTATGTKGGECAVNADLTKMKTDGKVSFNFKHALARIGGHKANEAASESSITIDAVADALTPGDTKQLANDTRISLKWLAIEVCGANKDDNKDAVYPTKGFFNLATGLWGQMATDPLKSKPVSYEPKNDPVYLLYPNGVEDFNYGNVTPFLNNKTTATYRKIPFNSELTVNGDGGDVYEGVITATGEETDDKGKAIPASSTWNTDATNKANAGVTTTSQSVYVSAEDAEPLLIIPNSTIKPKIRVIASYDIVTLDPAYVDNEGHNGYAKAHQVVDNYVTFKDVAQLNKKYALHIHLGVSSIQVNATVSDWDATTGTGESATENSEDIGMPENK